MLTGETYDLMKIKYGLVGSWAVIVKKLLQFQQYCQRVIVSVKKHKIVGVSVPVEEVAERVAHLQIIVAHFLNIYVAAVGVNAFARVVRQLNVGLGKVGVSPIFYGDKILIVSVFCFEQIN